MVSQILWRQAELKGKRSSSESLCKVDELCDHLKDMKFEDVHKVEENSKVKRRKISNKPLEINIALSLNPLYRKLVIILATKICPMTTNT